MIQKNLSEEIGKRVTVTACSPQSVVDATGVIKRIYSDTEALQQVYVKLDPEFAQGPHENGEWIINGWNEIVPDAIPADVHHAQIERLEKALADANARVETLRDRPQAIVTCIGEHLIHAAEENDMCGVYDDEVKSANEKLEKWGVSLPLREKEREISWEETYTVTVRRHATVTMSDDDDKLEETTQRLNSDCDASQSEILSAVRSGNYSSEYYVEDSARFE